MKMFKKISKTASIIVLEKNRWGEYFFLKNLKIHFLHFDMGLYSFLISLSHFFNLILSGNILENIWKIF